MKNKSLFGIAAGLVLVFSTGCTLSLARTPSALVVPFTLPSMTPVPTTLSPTPVSSTATLPSITPETSSATPVLPTITSAPEPSLTPVSIGAGLHPGPYAVILTAPGDVLNIHSGPGDSNAVSGSFSATASDIMGTGSSSVIDGEIWMEVQNPSGGTGWVNSNYLTEQVTPAAFCTDAKVITLIAELDSALKSSNGGSLGTLVSPTHGMHVYLWRKGSDIVFDQDHALYVFSSTYEHNWGASPGSGLNTIGAFHDVVLPDLLEVFNTSYTLQCNQPQTGGVNYTVTWPAEFININFYSIYKPGPPGNELSWRTWLVGVEYVKSQPYLFALIHFAWEP